MERNLGALEEREFDIAVVGGGITGICTAWDAALRGLSVALIERGDFAEETSAHSFRMVHGGIRYLQHADLPRIRESVRERRALLRVAPHLVEPLPIVIPTFGHGMQGKAALGAGFKLYDLCAADRNRGIRDPARRIPPGRLLSRREALALFPDLDRPGLTGAGVFSDGQMYNPPRLALAFLESAVAAGAVVANYVAATGFHLTGKRVDGVEATDVLGGGTLRIRAAVVVNAAGPWAPGLLDGSAGPTLTPGATFSRDTCFVLRRAPRNRHGLAVLGATHDPDALLSRAARHLFLVPWRGYTLLGVWHKVFPDHPDTMTVTRAELDAYLAEVNAASPALQLTPDDVNCFNAGLVLFGDNAPGAKHLSYGHRARVVDHAEADGHAGLITSIGVRWTTARAVAQEVVDLAGRKLGRTLPGSRTAYTRIRGGQVDDIEHFVSAAVARRPAGITDEAARTLARNHGSAMGEVLAHVERDAALGQSVAGTHVIEAEVAHAVRDEMAQRLADVVYRRTDLGTGERPTRAALEQCARILAGELGWTPERSRDEITRAEAAFPVPV